MSGMHTPGRLFVAEDIEDDTLHPETVIRGMGGHACIAVALDFGAKNPDWREANAKRIVACWNALDGLHDDALGGGWTAAGMNAYAKDLEGKVRTLRAMLLVIKVLSDRDEIADHHEGMPCTSAKFDAAMEGVREVLKGGAT